MHLIVFGEQYTNEMATFVAKNSGGVKKKPKNSLVTRFVFQRIWIAISWSIMAQTRKILTDAYTSRINRG